MKQKTTMNEISLSEQRRQEGDYVLQIKKRLLDQSNQILKSSQLFSEEMPLEETDVDKVEKFIQACNPITKDNYMLHAHLQLTKTFAENIVQKLKTTDPHTYQNINISEIKVLALVHDFGRIVTNRYFRNDVLGSYLLKQLHIRSDVIKKIPSNKRFMKKDPHNDQLLEETISAMGVEEKIIVLADLCGKPNISENAPTDIKTFKEALEYHNTSMDSYEPSRSPIWPSEQTLDSNLRDFSAKCYVKLKKWFLENGVDVDQIREKIHKEKQIAPIQAIAVDVGGVIIKNPDPSIKKEIEKQLHLTQNQCEAMWNDLIPQLQTGKLNEDEFWSAVKERIPGNTLPSEYKKILTPKLMFLPEAKNLLKNLETQGKQIIFFTTTIPQHLAQIRELFKKTFDKNLNFISSIDIGIIKPKKEAYIILALRLGLPPHAICFIDDNKENVEAARSVGLQALLYTDMGSLQSEISVLTQ